MCIVQAGSARDESGQCTRETELFFNFSVLSLLRLKRINFAVTIRNQRSATEEKS